MRKQTPQLIGFFMLASLLASSLWANAGVFTTIDHSPSAFSRPFANLTPEQDREFELGNSFFRQAWVEAGASTTARDGLGPTFNARACASCHKQDGRGPGAGFGEGFAHVSLLFRIDETEEYGSQLNPLANPRVPAEVESYVKFRKIAGSFPDGESYELLEPQYEFRNWLLGAPKAGTRISARVGTQLIGLGLLERIADSEIENRADPYDRDADGISGRVSRVVDIKTGRATIGRFGWKAEQPTLEQQNAAALIGDLGITNSLHPNQNCPTPQLECSAARETGELEAPDRKVQQLTYYTQTIAVPTQREPADARTRDGRRLFTQVGCASCHQPNYNLDGETFEPFTDLLLHDMGEGLADRTVDGRALTTEWRTPPLWGIGLLQVVNQHTNLLHDGRARGVQEAILWHGGEATAARDAYRALSKQERANLIRFIESI